MPFLRDEGPPVSKDTIQRARESLPVEYGIQTVNETGREVLLVRVPKAKPDYLHDIADVAFYVGLDQIKATKDVLLIGHEKTARLEPQLLRDAIRSQDREDAELVQQLRRQLGRDYGQTILTSPSNHQHQALAIRIPKAGITEFSPDDVMAIREAVERQRSRFEACQYAYVLADRDHERLGRRVLLELIGAPTAAAPAAPLQPAPVAAAPPAPAVPLGARLPPTPGTATASASATPAAPSGLGALFGQRAGATAPLPAAPAALPPTPATFAPAPAPAPMPAAPAAPPAPKVAPIVDDHEEYAIISKPKAAAPPPPPPAPLAVAAPPGTERDVHEEYEIVSKPKPAAPPAPPPVEAPASEGDAEAPATGSEEPAQKHIVTEAYEVYTSKPKPRPTGPAITPPGQGGFQAALANATSSGGHSPTRTKEYEVVGASRAPPSGNLAAALHAHQQATAPIAPAFTPPPPAPTAAPAPAPAFAPMQAAAPAPTPMFAAPPRDDPRLQPALLARPAAAPAASPDNGAPIVPILAPANPEAILGARFKENGYDLVEGLRAQGTVFAFAAHKANGRRVLVKRATEFAAEDAPALAQLVSALGADLCLVVADKVGAGARLSTWGTRIEIVASADVQGLGF